MDITGFGTLGDPGHMAADAVGKRMNGMRHVVINYFMTGQTLLRSGTFGLKLGRGNAQLMNIMTGGTGYPFFGMGR